jgi:hypothetical protein
MVLMERCRCICGHEIEMHRSVTDTACCVNTCACRGFRDDESPPMPPAKLGSYSGPGLVPLMISGALLAAICLGAMLFYVLPLTMVAWETWCRWLG